MTDHDRLRAAVTAANIPTLLLVVYLLGGDRRWLADRYRPLAARAPTTTTRAACRPTCRTRSAPPLLDLIGAVLSGERNVPPPPSLEDLPELMSISVGEHVSDEYAPMMAEEMGFTERWVEPVSDAAVPTDFSVMIIGAGLSGIGLGIHLGRAGIPFSIVERGEALGGTWHDNTYPGCGVDTPSHLYCYSFESRYPWHRYYAKQPEIEAYIDSCADRYGVTDHIRFRTEVVDARFDEVSAHWEVTVRDRDGREHLERTPVLVSAVGQLNRPQWPAISGLDDFAGSVMHSAEWRHDVAIKGRSVAVLGTGASAMQIVPAIADEVAHLTVFQRSPQWAGPNQNYFDDVTEDVQFLIDRVPYYAAWYRFRLLWMFNDKVHRSLQIDPEWPHMDRSINSVNEGHRRFFTRYIERELEGRPDLHREVVAPLPAVREADAHRQRLVPSDPTRQRRARDRTDRPHRARRRRHRRRRTPRVRGRRRRHRFLRTAPALTDQRHRARRTRDPRPVGAGRRPGLPRHGGSAAFPTCS